jgi:hypothetical protein
MKEFEESNYRKFSDPNNIMSELFSVACSLCGYEEISFVAENTPESIGDIAKRAYDENPDMSDEEMDALMDGPIDAWQQVDDYNCENGIPTFLCFDCHEQLKNGDIKVSDILIGEEE